MLPNRTQRTIWSWLLAVAMVFATVQPAVAGARCCQGKDFATAQGCCGCCQADVQDGVADDGVTDRGLRACCRKRMAASSPVATAVVSQSQPAPAQPARSCCVARLKKTAATASMAVDVVADGTVELCECRVDTVPLLPVGSTEKAAVEQGHKLLASTEAHSIPANAPLDLTWRAAASAGGASTFPDVQVLYCSWLI